jgi:hypothetical protein
VNEKTLLRSSKLRLRVIGIRRADHVTLLYPQKLTLKFVLQVVLFQILEDLSYAGVLRD